MSNMKKFAPVIIVLVVFALLAGGGFYVYKSFFGAPKEVVEDEGPELDASLRPFVTITPTEDGHYMDLTISNINVPGAKKMEFELFYTTGEGNNQGTTGKVTLKGNDLVKNQILLGSESSGKFRYDQGVELGTLTIKFRDENGKNIGRTATTWRLQHGTRDLASSDGKFKYTLSEDSDAYFVTLITMGLPKQFDGTTSLESYGVFTSSEDPIAGTVSLGEGNLNMWNSQKEVWESVSNNLSENTGIFISSN